MEPTIFILGAGASLPYGLPSGRELRERILHSTSGKKFDHYLRAGFTEQDTRKFGTAFGQSRSQSIDVFLGHESNEVFSEIGKFAITSEIAKSENNDALMGTVSYREGKWAPNKAYESNSEGWYDIFWNKLDQTNFHLNGKYVFITFNYDRTLEHYLYQAYEGMNSEKKYSPAEIREKISHIKIIHVHGKIGDLPWQVDPHMKHLEFGETDPEKLRKASKNIKIISELNGDDEGFEEARGLIRNYDDARIFFLGFGFHPLNLARLGLAPRIPIDSKGNVIQSVLSNHRLFSTTKNLTKNKVSEIKEMLGRGFADEAYESCYRLINEYFS